MFAVSGFLVPVMKRTKSYRYMSTDISKENQYDFVSGEEIMQRLSKPECMTNTLLMEYLRMGNTGSTDPARPGFRDLLQRLKIKSSRKNPPVVSAFTTILPGICLSFSICPLFFHLLQYIYQVFIYIA